MARSGSYRTILYLTGIKPIECCLSLPFTSHHTIDHMNETLSTLSSAFSSAYPTVSDFASALKLANVQVALFFSSRKGSPSHDEDEEYSCLVGALFAEDSDLWCKVFCLAILLSNYVSIDCAWRERFVTDYSVFLCQSKYSSTSKQFTSIDKTNYEAQADVDESVVIGFHAFVVTQLSDVLLKMGEGVSALYTTLFESLVAIKYDNLMSLSGSISSLQKSTLFHVLHRVLTSYPADSSLWDTILAVDFQLMDKVMLIVLRTPTPSLRSKVVKLLFRPASEAMQSTQKSASSPESERRRNSSAAFVLHSWKELMQPLLQLEDIATASVVACCLVDLIALLPFDSLGVAYQGDMRDLSVSLWEFMCTCLNDGHSTTRRRGAHIMQRVSVGTTSKPVATTSSTVNTSAGAGKKKLGGQKKTPEEIKADKKQKKKKKDKYSEAESGDEACLFPSGGGGVTQDTWPLLFLDVYRQLEGCTSMHLLSQVWPQLNVLMILAADSGSLEEKDEGMRGFLIPPLLSFSWVKVLLNCCLQSQMSPIKKLIMHEILSGKLIIPLDKHTVEWFCGEFLSVVDSPALFTTAFSMLLVEKKWQRDVVASGDNIDKVVAECGMKAAGESDVADVLDEGSEDWREEQQVCQRNPGVLIAVFMAEWVHKLSQGGGKKKPNHSLLQQFLSCLLSRVSACHSSQAVKWIMRCFSFPPVQSYLICGQKGIFAMSLDSVLKIRTIVKEKMLCANVIIRRQINSGLINLLLRCRFDSPRCGDALPKLKVFLEIFESFGVRETVLIAGGWSHLSRSLKECLLGISSAEMGALSGPHMAILFGVAATCEGGSPGNCLSETLVNDLFSIAAQLYTSPYVEREKKKQVSSFVQHSMDFLNKVCVVGSPGVSRWLCGGDYTGGADVFMENIRLHGGGMTDYACFLVKSALDFTAAVSTHFDVTRGSAGTGDLVETVTEFQKQVDMLCQLLELSFMRVEIISMVLATKVFTSILALLKHSTTTLESLGARRKEGFGPFALLCNVIVISKILQALNRLQLLHTRVSADDAEGSFLQLYALHVTTEQYCDAVKSAVLAVSKVGCVPLVAYQQAAAMIRQRIEATISRRSATESDTDSTAAFSPSLRLLESISEEYPQYGRYSDTALFHTWASVSAGLSLLEGSAEKYDGIAITTVLSLLELSVEDLSLASSSTIPYLLSSCRLLVGRAHRLNLFLGKLAKDQRNSPNLPNLQEGLSGAARLIGRIVEVAWTAVMSDEDMDFVSIQSFILLAFDTATLSILDSSLQQEFFEAVLKVGLTNRPHVVQALLLQLCSVWKVNATLSLVFFPYFSSLLVYREPILDDHNRVDGVGKDESNGGGDGLRDTLFTVTESSNVLGIDKFNTRYIARTLLLDFLEGQHASQDVEFVQRMHELIAELVRKNTQAAFKSPAMIGTELFGEKLRSWQALCVLSAYVTQSLWMDLSGSCFDVLTYPCAHGIRVHMEIFFAAMAVKIPELILPHILDLLLVFNHTQQALSSYFVILGHLTVVESPHSRALLGEEKTKGMESDEGENVRCGDSGWSEKIVTVLVPWATCSPGLPRAVAQLLAYRLIPRIVPVSFMASGHFPPTLHGSSSLDVSMLQEIWRFLHENNDINKMCKKQLNFFESYDLTSKCTVRGLLSIHCDEWGERIPPHILNILLKSVRDTDDNEGLTDSGNDSNVGGINFATAINRKAHAGGAASTQQEHDDSASAVQLQTKITPFDNLQLAIESSILTRQNTSTDRPRQDLIVVASLIDKVTNLAGIARTCEIFAAKELVLSDLGVVKSHDFQSISVASAGWMPMREVAYQTGHSTEMIFYLREMKAKGYQIVGIEQTGVSVALSNSTPLSSKSLIVLGKEKEGIPVELLAEMDLCIEIPQYGLTRSLNVHVSAALVIWEATKRNMNIA